jgi:diguanylate cyclase (GGDEF)-like protein
MAMLLVIIILGLFSLILSQFGIYSKPEESEMAGFVLDRITLVSILILAIEYAIGRSRYYPLAAVLAVGTLLSATFVVVITYPDDLQFLFFLILGGLVGSLFLSARATATIFFVTIIGLLVLPAFAPGLSAKNNIIALIFILTVGGLVVMAAALRQRYLEKLNWRTQQLVESEARFRELSIRDSLTGLFNRRNLFDLGRIEISRAERFNRPFSVLILDIDHFKRINDNHGHPAGDIVLQEIARLCREAVRDIDLVGRYGGEEFIILMPETDLLTATKVAERMRERIEQSLIPLDGRFETITVSIGVAVKDENTAELETLIARADQAMYIAKHRGRNRVAVSR